MNEPALSIFHASLKLQWANVLINNFNTHLTQFVDRKPFDVSARVNQKGTGYGLHVTTNQAVPYIMQILAGEACGAMRQSLDYCWMGLVRASYNGADYPSKATFPIADNRKGLISTVNNCLLYTSPSPRDQRGSRMPSSA